MSLPERAQQLIARLELLPHPEGGFYKETYRSGDAIPGKDRQLLTSIYFLVTGSNMSRFHRIQSDECWYFHEGNGLTVHVLDENGHSEHRLGTNLEKGERPFYVVKAGAIFGSALTDGEGYALVSCAVAPGFDFRDFELFTYDELVVQFPEEAAIIRKLT